MVGRPKETKLKGIEKKIRTIAWFKSVLTTSGAKNTNQLINLVDPNLEGLRKLSNYSTGKNIPSRSTLKLIDNLFPSTQEVFDEGPCKSLLFKAMGGDIELLIDDMETNVNSFVWLSPISHEISFNKIDNTDLKEVINIVETIYLEDSTSEINAYTDGLVESQIVYLSGCIILLRFAIQRDFFHHGSYVDDILNLIFHLLDNDKITNFLNSFAIKPLFKEWLFYLIKDWCKYCSIYDQLDMHSNFPSKKEFIDNPHIFHTSLLEAYITNAEFYLSDIDFNEDISKLVASKKVLWFQRYENINS